MVSIAEDQSLPVDFNGTSLQLSGGGMDSTLHDQASLSNSDIETPGMHPTLNSVGGISPHRVRTMKDQELHLSELRKENFGLKLRIYHLEEALNTKWGERSEGWQLNIDLQVQMDNLRKELAEKDELIMQARSGLQAMAAKHAQELNELREAVRPAGDLNALQERLEDKEAELEEAQQQTEEAAARANEMQQASEQLEEDLRQKEREMEDMQRQLDDVRKDLSQQMAAASPQVVTRNAKVQTAEPVVGRAEFDTLQTQLSDVGAQLREKEREIVELRGEVGERGRRVRELEVEVLTASEKMAAGAGIHARQMSEQATQLDQCRAGLRDAEAELRRKGAEFGERERECRERERETEEARRRAREAEERADSLEPHAQAAEREAKELRRQLRDAQAEAEDEAGRRARDMRDVEERLREAEERLGRSQPEMAARQRELEEMARTIRQKEEEISQLRSRLGEKEGELSRARQAAHAANMERQEQARALGELRGELGALKDQLQQKQASVQQSTEAALAAKDAIIGQLQRELQDLRAKLADADNQLLQVSTTKAAELGVAQGVVDDLTQQVEQLEGQLDGLKKEVGKLKGEKAALLRETARLRAQSDGEKDRLAQTLAELATKTDQLEAACRAVGELQKMVNQLQRDQPSREHLQREAAEKAQLKSQLAALRAALANKETEAERLTQVLEMKDGTIAELQEQLERVGEEREREGERAADLQRENSALQDELARLQSQGRIAQLSSEDLQGRLTDAYREREELARRLRQAEETLGNKESAYERARRACEALQKQVARLQEQVKELSRRADTVSVGVSTSSPGRQDSGVMAGGVDESVGTSPPQPTQAGAPSSTTMIFGSLSEDLLKTILQRLQEIYSEILNNRTSGKQTSSTLVSKMEHLTDLQRHLESCFHETRSTTGGQDSKPPSGNASYTTYYFMRGDEGEPLANDPDNEAAEEEEIDASSPPKKSSTPKKQSPRTSPRFDRREAQQISALQSELEEVKRWNEAMQTRLRESGGRRDVGVGMEKGGSPPQTTSLAQEKLQELEAEVDRLLGELEMERERSQVEREEQETECAGLRGELSAVRERVGELEEQLREAVVGTSTAEAESLRELEEEVEGMGRELGKAREVVARLNGELLAEREDNRKLREEIGRIRSSPGRTDRGTSTGPAVATASAPNLLTPDKTPGKRNMSDSWTSPGVTQEEEGLDVRALRERHEEVTRLNQKLQRKCREQLHKSPPSAAASQPGVASGWQSKSREEEESSSERLRESEERATRRETEWRERERELRRQLEEFEGRLDQTNQDCQTVRSRLSESLAACREKDEERVNLTRSLSQSKERVRVLERQLQESLSERGTVVGQLEETQRDLRETRERAEELEESLGRLGRGEEEEGELEVMQESVDSLTHQLSSALQDLERLQKHNSGLEEQRTLLHSQLSTCQEQVSALQTELNLYRQLLQDSGKTAGSSGGGVASSSGRLLEEVRKLQEQLRRGVRNTDALARQLRSKLDLRQPEDEVDLGAGQTTPRVGERAGHTGLSSSAHVPSGPPETKISLGGLGTLTVRADVRMSSDGSGTSLPQLSLSDRTPRKPGHSLHLSAPRSHSSPLVKGAGLQTSSHAHSTSARLAPRSGEEAGTAARASFSDYVAREGIPKLEPTIHPPTTGSVPTVPNVPAAHTSPPHRQSMSTEGGRRRREYESLESRLREALENSNLQGVDPSFLEELLGYLRQQRSQLDESRQLLESLERQRRREEGGASRVAMETSQSGTIPSASTAAGGHDGGRGRGRGASSRVDLKSLYNHLVKTQASLMEARSNLTPQQKKHT